MTLKMFTHSTTKYPKDIETNKLSFAVTTKILNSFYIFWGPINVPNRPRKSLKNRPNFVSTRTLCITNFGTNKVQNWSKIVLLSSRMRPRLSIYEHFVVKVSPLDSCCMRCPSVCPL